MIFQHLATLVFLSLTDTQAFKIAVFSWNANHENVAESFQAFETFHDLPMKYFDDSNHEIDLLIMCIQEDQNTITVPQQINKAWKRTTHNKRQDTLAGGHHGQTSAYIYEPINTAHRKWDSSSVKLDFEGSGLMSTSPGKGYVYVATDFNENNVKFHVNVGCAHLHAHEDYEKRSKYLEQFFTNGMKKSKFSVLVGDFNYRLQVQGV